MIRFRTKTVRDEAATGALVIMMFGYAIGFLAFCVMFILGEFPPAGLRTMLIALMVGMAANVTWLVNREEDNEHS